MQEVSIEEAQANLADLIHHLVPGDGVVVTENGRPVAVITSQQARSRRPRRPGTLRGTVLYMAPDFDAPLC